MRRALAVVMVVAASACAPGAGPDVLADDDAGVAFLPPWDAGTQATCANACGEGWGCVRGTCVPGCGADVAALEAALNPALRVTFAFCDAPARAAIPRDVLYTLEQERVGDEVRLTLSQRVEQYVYPQGEVVVPQAEGFELVGALSMSHAAASFAFRTAAAPHGTAVVMRQTPSGMQGVRFAAPGYADALFVQQREVFVSALGFGALTGPGVYAVNVDDPTTASRHVTLAAETVPGSLAHFSAWGGFLLVGVTTPAGEAVLAMSEGGPVTSEGDARVTRLELPARFVGLHDDSLATFVPQAAGGGIEVRSISPAAGGYALGAPVRWTVGDTFSDIARTGYGAVLLRHARGYWLIAGP